jgi:hypothetical protein
VNGAARVGRRMWPLETQRQDAHLAASTCLLHPHMRGSSTAAVFEPWVQFWLYGNGLYGNGLQCNGRCGASSNPWPCVHATCSCCCSSSSQEQQQGWATNCYWARGHVLSGLAFGTSRASLGIQPHVCTLLNTLSFSCTHTTYHEKRHMFFSLVVVLQALRGHAFTNERWPRQATRVAAHRCCPVMVPCSGSVHQTRQVCDHRGWLPPMQVDSGPALAGPSMFELQSRLSVLQVQLTSQRQGKGAGAGMGMHRRALLTLCCGCHQAGASMQSRVLVSRVDSCASLANATPEVHLP